MKPESLLPVHKDPQQLCLEPAKLIHIFITLFFNIHFNIILPSTSTSPNRTLNIYWAHLVLLFIFPTILVIFMLFNTINYYT
jgi:hypothetical protein